MIVVLDIEKDGQRAELMLIDRGFALMSRTGRYTILGRDATLTDRVAP